MMSVGSRKSATRSSIASYLGSASASLAQNLEISRCVSALSGPSISERPSGNGVNDDGLRGSISKPCRASSRSRMISGRSRLLTYAAVETLYPGHTSSVTHAPPSTSRRSSTNVLRPGAGGIRRGHEPVVATADDDEIVGNGHEIRGVEVANLSREGKG